MDAKAGQRTHEQQKNETDITNSMDVGTKNEVIH